MRILWLNTPLLLPLDKGGKLRTWHLMRHLKRRNHITCISFADPAQLATHRGAMSEVCDELVTVARRESTKEGLRFYASVARHLLDPVPYAVGQYRSREYHRVVRTALGSGAFDRIVCDFLVPAINLPDDLPCPGVLFTHNVEAEIWRRHAETEKNPLRKRLYATQWRRMHRFEGRTIARFDRVLAVSDVDRDTLQRLYAGQLRAPVSVVPTGVDTGYFTPAPIDPGTKRVVFTGSMDWLPNVDAVQYFAHEILPIIRSAEPDVAFTIVGRSPTPAVRRLADDAAAIEVTGRVEDVRPYLAKSAVYIVPLRIGGGTRLKIFEAMAAGRPVVSTSVGAEGLPVEHGRHLLLADTPEDFARSVVTLLRDAEARARIAREARALVTERYDWGAAALHLEAALSETRIAAAPAAAASMPLTSVKRVKPL